MADLRYTVDVDTRGAQTALNGLRSTIFATGAAIAGAFSLREITQIAARFEDLRITLGILYGDTQRGAQVFEQLKAFATQSVLGVDDLTESVIKLKAAGLEPTIDQLRLFSDVASVSADRIGVLQAITDLYARTTAGGLGLEDLNRLADRGIPVFSILSERLGISRLEISKLGQTAEGANIILRALEEGLQEAFGGASQQRIGSLSQGISNLQDALMNAADALGQAGFGQALTDAASALTQFIETNEPFIRFIGQAIGGAISFVIENAKILTVVLAAAFAGSVARQILVITSAVFEFAKGLRTAATAGAILQGVTGIGLVKLAAGVAAAAGIVEGINAMVGDTSDNIDQLTRDLEALPGQLNIPEGPLTAPSLDTSAATSDARALLDQLRQQQAAVTNGAISYFDEYREGVEDLRRAVDQESELLRMTESQANVQRELNQFTQRYYDTIRPLQREVTELRLKDTEESRAQATEIERQIGLITELYESSISGLREQLMLREANRREEEALILLLDNRRKLEDDFRDLVRESQQELEDLNLTPFQRELAAINRAVDDQLVASIRNLKNAWEDGLITSDEYIAEIERLRGKAEETEAVLVENARRAREIQRSFAYGWKQAFESYVEDATNAAKAAEQIFNKTFRGMEDLIVNFVKTGKFEFKSFVASVLEDMLRLQVRQILTGVMSGGARGSNLGDFFAGFFANGGTIPAGTFGVVGERGPELVSGPATVTPNFGGQSNVTYNIQAVDAASFKSLVARDPAFIHAVAQQGARKVPMGR